MEPETNMSQRPSAMQAAAQSVVLSWQVEEQALVLSCWLLATQTAWFWRQEKSP